MRALFKRGVVAFLWVTATQAADITQIPLTAGHDPVENIASKYAVSGGCGGVAYTCPSGYMIQWSGGVTCGRDRGGYRLIKNVKASDTNNDTIKDTLVIQCVDQLTTTMQGAPVVGEGSESFKGCYLHDDSVTADVMCRRVRAQ